MSHQKKKLEEEEEEEEPPYTIYIVSLVYAVGVVP
jgi:hypothetical protein